MSDPAGEPVHPAGTDEEEQSLLDGLRRGEDAAFERLVTLYGPRLRATALRLLRNDSDALDVVQETFLCAFRAIARFEARSRLSTWLHRIAVNAALMKIRSRERRGEVDIEPLLPRFEDGGQHKRHQNPFRGLPEDEVEREQTAALVHRCIDELPAPYRNALILKDIEGLDYPEVAHQLCVTVNAARIRIHRARQALRTLLEPHLGMSR